MGDPMDPTNRVGALVSKAHFDKVCSYLEKGPKVILGGKADACRGGGFVEPTILDIFAGRDNGIHAHDQYRQVKTVWFDLADDADQAVGCCAWASLGPERSPPPWCAR